VSYSLAEKTVSILPGAASDHSRALLLCPCMLWRGTAGTPERVPWPTGTQRKLSNIQSNCWQFPVTTNCLGLSWTSATSIPLCP